MEKTQLRYFVFLLLSILLFLPTCGGGDGGDGGGVPWTGTKQLGTASDDRGWGVAVDGSGNIYVTGYTNGGLDGNTNAGGNDIFLVKYDSGGTKQWTRQLGTALTDHGKGVAVDGSGNVYVTGYTNGGLDGNTNAGGNDIFLVKYDSAGTKQWTRQRGTASDDEGWGVAVDGSGNVYISGRTSGGPFGSFDMVLLKYNNAGTYQWTRTLGATSNDGGTGVAVDAAGNIYVTGYTTGSLDGNTNSGWVDMLLVKYNNGGIWQWTRQIGTASTDYGFGVDVDGSGNVYVTGYTGGGLDGNTSAGGNDIFLVKYDSAGTKQWTRQRGTASDDGGRGVAVDAAGNIYVTGYTEGGLDGNTNSGGYDMLLVKYNNVGIWQWTRQLGTASSDAYGYGVAVDGSGNVYVSGYTNGGLDGNTSAGGNDIFLVKYDSDGVKQ